MSTVRLCCLILAASVACVGGDADNGGGRMAMALSGQFFPGELTSLDVIIYAASDVECYPSEGRLSTEPSSHIERRTGLDLESLGEVNFSLPRGDYVVHLQAGRQDGGDLVMVASGCATVDLGNRAEVTINLHRADTCGDDELDIQEMCDDGNTNNDDGCDDRCRTEHGFVNGDDSATEDFWLENQMLPVACGHSDRLVVSWQSGNFRSGVGPYAWFNSLGGEGDPLRHEVTGTRRDPSGVDSRNENTLITFFFNYGGGTIEPYILGWFGRTTLDFVAVGVRGDTHLVGAFVSATDIVTVSADGAGALALREVQITIDGFVVGGTTWPVDDLSPGQTAPAIAGGEREFVVAWEDSEGQVWARYFENASTPPPGSAESLCDAVSDCSQPSVAYLGGRFLIVYRGPNNRIVGRFMDDSGGLGEQFEIADEDRCRQPVVEPFNESHDEFLVAWTQPVNPSSGDEDPAHIYARIVTDEDLFGHLATGTALTDRPYQVTPEDETGYDQPAIATAIGTSSEATAIVFYRDMAGNGETGALTDIGYRVVRATRVPGS